MASPDNPKFENQPHLEKMPAPRYVYMDKSRSNPQICINSRSFGEEVRPHFLIRNFVFGDLISKESRHEAASFLVRMKMKTGVDAALSYAVLPLSYKRNQREVATFQDNKYWGIYVDAKPADLLSVFDSSESLAPEAYFRNHDSKTFEKLFKKAVDLLPAIILH